MHPVAAPGKGRRRGLALADDEVLGGLIDVRGVGAAGDGLLRRGSALEGDAVDFSTAVLQCSHITRRRLARGSRLRPYIHPRHHQAQKQDDGSQVSQRIILFNLFHKFSF